MKRKNKHGYNQQETYFYEIEVNESIYFVEVDVTWFVKPADSSTWDSPDDYYGFTEILDAKITHISLVDENSNETEVEFKKLPEDEQKRIQVILDELIDKQEPDYD